MKTVMSLPSLNEPTKFREQKPTAEQMAVAFREAQDLLEILNSGGSESGEIVSISEAKDLGIELRMALTNGVLVYEVKIPFTGNDGTSPFVVAPRGTKTIGVGFVTGKTPPSDMPQGRGPGNTGSPGDLGAKGARDPAGEVFRAAVCRHQTACIRNLLNFGQRSILQSHRLDTK